MASEALAKTQEQLQRAQGLIRRMKEKGEEIGQRIALTTLTMGGGAAAGLARVYQPDLPIIEMPTDLTIGGGLALFGCLGVAGDWSDELCALGGGMAAAGIAKMVEDGLRASG
jgi:hypothetical protein